MLSGRVVPSSISLVTLSTSDGNGIWRDDSVDIGEKKLSLAWELTDDVRDLVPWSRGDRTSKILDPDSEISNTAGPEKSLLKSINESTRSCCMDVSDVSSFKLINESDGVIVGVSSDNKSGLFEICHKQNNHATNTQTHEMIILTFEGNT